MKENIYSIIRATLFIALLASIFGCLGNQCSRNNNVSYWDLPDELNKLYNCPRKVVACTGSTDYSDYELVTNPNYLWSNSDPNYFFSVQEQDAMITAAKSWANQNLPTCPISGKTKGIYDIQFQLDFTTPIGLPPTYIIYAEIVFVCCDARLPS